MDLRHLRYFTVLGEELNFTRAAARLGIRQPPLSTQIKQLETEIGAPLFRRLSRGIELTVSGEAFLHDVRTVLVQLSRAVDAAESLARGQTGRIRLGFSGATYMPAAISAAILRFRELFPGVELFPEQSNTPLLVHGLRERTIDAAFIRPPYHVGTEIKVEPFFEEPMLAVLPTYHPLAGRGAVALKDLAGEVFTLFPRQVGPGLYDSIVAACIKSGFSPRLGQEASQIVAAVPMIAAGFGVSIVPASVSALKVPGVSYLKIEGATLKALIGLAWRRTDASPALRNFLATVRRPSRGTRKRAEG